METNNKSIIGATKAENDSLDQNIPSLKELIADVDNEIALSIDPTTIEEDISTDPGRSLATLQDQYILMELEKTLFAFPLSSALEIGQCPVITPLPNLPNWILGISNIRGQIISFINLKAFFGIPSTRNKSDRRFLIIQNRDLKIGIIVDRIMGIFSLNQIDINLQNSPYREGKMAEYILGMAVSEDTLTNIIDVDKLLSCDRMTEFKQLS